LVVSGHPAEARRLWSTRSSGIDPRAERQRQIRAREEAEVQERLACERRITVQALFDRWAATDLQPRVLADGTPAATLMASLGMGGDVIDERLNHIIESRVRRTYVRDRRSAEQACAFEALGARLQYLTTEVQRRKSARRPKHDTVATRVKDALLA
jgi:hypothetical protein